MVKTKDAPKKKIIKKTKTVKAKAKAGAKTKAKAKIATKSKVKTSVTKTKSSSPAKKSGTKKVVKSNPKVKSKIKSKVKAKPKAKPKAATKKVVKTKKIRAKDLLDKLDLDEDFADLDELEDQINYESSSETSNTDLDPDTESDEGDCESEEEIDVDEDEDSESEQIEYEMDEYESNQAGTERHTLLKETLFATFGYGSFKPEQYRIVDSILDGVDVLGVMPTGYGKSLCFQLPPLITNEVSIVISPLIALMADQQASMTKLGISSCCYNSTITVKQKKDLQQELIDGEHQILYVTPESLDRPEFRRLIDKIYSEVGICMVAVDEAHCVSSYGFDFRPKYRNIVKIRKYLPDVPVLAVTATATDKVMEDIVKCLSMDNGIQIKTSFDRPNLFINIKEIKQNTIEQIANLISNCNGSVIIYCLTQKSTEMLNVKLKIRKIKSVAYHGGLTNTMRTDAQTKFMEGDVDCICATIAFGMGINKSNVRLVVHYGCPKNIESYYQEIGRAGRDGKPAECWLFYRQADFRIQNIFIQKIKDPIFKTTCTRLLYTITKYVTDKKCRRKELLNYFSEDYKKDNCGKCDNCCSVQKAIDKKDEANLFKLLSTVLEMETEHRATYGKNKIILIMRGSNAKGIAKWMKQLPYYGAYQNIKKADATRLIETAIDMNYMKYTCVGETITVVKCTEYGLAFGQEYEKKLNKISTKKKKNVGKIKII
jgi:Mimiviridae putative ATP-dependent RNA helicase